MSAFLASEPQRFEKAQSQGIASEQLPLAEPLVRS